MNQKERKLLKLAKKRQNNCYPGFKNLCDYHNGYYECDYVSPYSKSADNVDSDIMIVLQDWSADEILSKKPNPIVKKLGHDPSLPTNKNLFRLFENHFEKRYDNKITDTYITNLFPFIKEGTLSDGIYNEHFDQAAGDYALPQIDIIKPKLVIALGLKTYDSLRYATGKNKTGDSDFAISNPFNYEIKDKHNNVTTVSKIWCQAHTGYFGQMGRNKKNKNQVNEDWEKMATWHGSKMEP